ncbi:MAG: FmdB family zinc ribbon protein [Oceanipulchritudo sp.]
MPTYEYACEHCGNELEVFQRMSDDPLEVCPACHTPSLKRKIGLGAGIIFKGGGFYETDFKDRKGKPPKEGDSADKNASGKETAGKPVKENASSASKTEPASKAAS